MILLVIFLACLFISLGAGFQASLSDLRGLTIPNMYSVIVIAAFFAAYAALWLGGQGGIFAPLMSHLLAALLVFVVTAALFAARAIGAADSKLATAFALWMGLRGLMPFLFYMTLVGGLLGLAALALHRWKPVKAPREGGWIARVQAGENKVAYGVAIVLGALASFVKLGYLGGEVLRSFLV